MKRTAIVLIGLLALSLGASSALAYPSLFDDRCASCHSDDTPTCNGCHEHGARNLEAIADELSYTPSAQVVVTLDGGEKHSWIRGILYDHNNLVVALASGPTGTGDNSSGSEVEFPVDLVSTAPDTNGSYDWEAAWFGGNTDGNGHGEQRVPVTIVVEGTATSAGTWSQIKSLF